MQDQTGTPNAAPAAVHDAAAALDDLAAKMYTSHDQAESKTPTAQAPQEGEKSAQTAESKPQTPQGSQADQGEKAPDQGEKKPEVVSTAEYGELNLPEAAYGTQTDPKIVGEFAALAREHNLSKDQAQKFLDFGGAKIKAAVEAPYKQWADQQIAWQAEVKKDSEIGGKNFESSVKAAQSIFKPGDGNPFVKDEAEASALRKALAWTGAGNNPAVVKFFVRAAGLMSRQNALNNRYDKM
jgi:hypothetical protein